MNKVSKGITKIGIVVSMSAILLWFGVLSMINGCNEQVYTTGVVQEHHVTADENGRARYNVLIKLSNGKLIERHGLNFYSKSDGAIVRVVLYPHEK